MIVVTSRSDEAGGDKSDEVHRQLIAMLVKEQLMVKIFVKGQVLIAEAKEEGCLE